MLGAEIVHLLKLRGVEVLGFHRGNLDMTILSRDPHLLFQNIDTIVNAAAYTNVDRAETQQREAYLTNATLPRMLALAAMEVGAHFIQISTDYVFRGDSLTPYLPGDSPDPVSVYGKSKWEGEKSTLDFDNTRVIRTAWLYGAHGNCFPKAVMSKLRREKGVSIVGDQVGSPTSASYLAEFVIRSAIEPLERKILHGVSSGEASWYEFGIEVAKQIGSDPGTITEVSSEAFPTIAKRPRFSLLEPSQLDNLEIPSWRDAWRAASRSIVGS